jgi:hypothetical protein
MLPVQFRTTSRKPKRQCSEWDLFKCADSIVERQHGGRNDH